VKNINVFTEKYTIMKNELIILPSLVSKNQLKQAVNKDSDILALTPAAMLSSDMAGYAYKTVDDFYNTEIFRKDLLNFNKNIELLFAKLDILVKDVTCFRRAFSSNIYWFLCLFADILYIEKVKESIEKEYSSVCLMIGQTVVKINWSNLTYRDLMLLPQSRGLSKKIDLLYTALNPRLLRINQIDAFSEPNLNEKATVFFFRVRRKMEKFIRQLKIRKEVKKSFKNHKNIFIAQDGYEVKELKPYLFDNAYLYPMRVLEDCVKDLEFIENDFVDEQRLIEEFFDKTFPFALPYILDLFRSYNREVVCRYQRIRELFKSLFTNYAPKMVLFATCAHQPFEGLLAEMAIEKQVPVIYFQHGGATVFVKHIYQKYLERNPAIKKKLILNSKKEFSEASHEGSECMVIGSTRLYVFVKKNTQKTKTKKALYCCGPFPYVAYKQLFATVSDAQCYQVNRDIIQTAKDIRLPLDIKLHPSEQNLSYQYFKLLIKDIDSPSAKIIYGVPAEMIMNRYGLIVLEYLPTAVLPYALVLDRPVVLYLKDPNVINPLVRDDLEQRCYIVNDRISLDNVLRKYVNNDLPSKWSSKIIDQYAYPISDGNPAPVIANYLQRLMTGDVSKAGEDAPDEYSPNVSK